MLDDPDELGKLSAQDAHAFTNQSYIPNDSFGSNVDGEPCNQPPYAKLLGMLI